MKGRFPAVICGECIMLAAAELEAAARAQKSLADSPVARENGSGTFAAAATSPGGERAPA